VIYLFLGVYDALPQDKILDVLFPHLPRPCFNKLIRYIKADPKQLRSCVHWDYFKTHLNKLDIPHCSAKLKLLLNKVSVSDKCVKIFHVSKNKDSKHGVEPNLENTAQMIYNFLIYIYQRNVLATIVKYILLQSILQKLETFPYNKTGIISIIYSKLKKIVHECILTAFNGSNYDNYLLCNYFLIIQSKIHQKIVFYKKGASISTMHLKFNYNLTKLNKITKCPSPISKSQLIHKWPLNLYVKDVRNLVAANMSLDKLGQLFNLPVSKLCFPYNRATSIKTLKSLTSLNPRDNLFWTDTFGNKQVSLETRLNAQKLFELKKFRNLYDYSIYYLKLDCMLLHLVVNTLFNNYLTDNINIFVRKNFSQSNLSYEQFFIIEPSKQIKQNLAPTTIKNSFINYVIKRAVTGGICTSFVHDSVNTNTLINEHFKFVEPPKLNETSWPNFANISNWSQSFNDTPSGIATYDIRSLYPSAALKKLPVGMPFVYSRFVPNDFEQIQDKYLFTYNVNSFCKTIQNEGKYSTDYFKLLNKPIYGCKTEFNVLEYYLKNLPHKDIKILRFQSNFTALGQLFIANYPVDGFLSYFNTIDKNIYIKVIQYNSVIYHGHSNKCTTQNTTEKEINKSEHTLYVKTKIIDFFTTFKTHFNLPHINFEYVEIPDCDFNLHKFPFSTNFMSFRSYYQYNCFLENIYNNKINGFLVVKDLEIKKENQNPIFGFYIQKVEYGYNSLSPYTQNQLKKPFSSEKRVVSLHKSKSFSVISTEYFRWLYKTFGFEHTPDIYHAILFQTEHYLRHSIENKLTQRKLLKDAIKVEQNVIVRQNMEIQAELIKLMLNSCYGFTLCNIDSEKFKIFKLRTSFPTHVKRYIKYKSCIEINNKTFLVETKKRIEHFHSTLLGHVGSAILFQSKIILLKRLYFLLKYLNPTKAQLLYMDTDSAHFLVKHKQLVDNVDNNLKLSFMLQFDKHFESGNKISGIWVQEGFFTSGEYIGEKSYKLYNNETTNFLVHMKGLNTHFQNQFVTQNIDHKLTPCISNLSFFKSPDFLIYKIYLTKDLFSNFVPVKRYFICSNGSLPLKL